MKQEDLVPRSYLSIGEVLSLLKEEFEDVTISKIRFLESQGLLDPERTPSGYRKFYSKDIERLRWILLQQKEHFLPLKVIKDRLSEIQENGDNLKPVIKKEMVEQKKQSLDEDLSIQDDQQDTSLDDNSLPGLASTTYSIANDSKPEIATEDIVEVSEINNKPKLAKLEKTSSPAVKKQLRVQKEDELTLEAFCRECDLDKKTVEELEFFGLITKKFIAGDNFYGPEAVEVGKLAAEFSRYGVEVRHLKMYKNFADREAGLFEQIIMPYLKRKNPEPHEKIVEIIQDLMGLGDQIMKVLLENSLSKRVEF